MRISVVIPTRGGGRPIGRVLDRLARQTEPPANFEVIVVSDAADAEPARAAAAVEARPFAARWCRADSPGASAARNVGWRAASAPLVLFLDDDVLAGPRLIESHLAAHVREPEVSVGVLGGLRWADEIAVTPFMRWLERGIQFDYDAIRGDEAGWWRFYTANASVKHALLERSGGFDEQRLPFGYEDLDLAYRMHGLGFRLSYVREAAAEHLHPMDIGMWTRQVRRIARAERSFVEKHPELPAYFHGIFSSALESPRRSRAAVLSRLVPPRTPWLGPRVASSVDLRYRRLLAPHFMEAWSAATPHGSETRLQ